MNGAFFVVHRFSLGAVLCARSTAVSVVMVLAVGLSLPATIRFANQTRDDGQFTLPSMHIWNVRIGKDVRRGARRVEAAVHIFNVTNRGAFYLLELGANQTFSPLYGQGRQRQTPRAAQISARYVF